MLALLLAAALAVPPDPSTIAWEVPPSAAAGASDIRDSGSSFGSFALSWSGPPDSVVSVRVSSDLDRWSEWIVPAIDDDSTDRSSGQIRSAIVHLDAPARWVEVRRDGGAEAATVVVFPPARREPAGRARTLGYPVGAVQVRSRLDWGCPDGEGSRWTPGYSTVTHAVVHHTAGSNSVADWEAEVRSIWYYHTFTNGWGDIGYNFLIDPNGVVYEGRAGGYGAIGAHFSCRNTNTVGIALLGTFTSVAPTPAAISSLELLLGELCRRNGIDPLATALHVPSGLTVPTIIGHRDGNDSPLTCTRTECPGDTLYAMLPSIRVAAACVAPAVTMQPVTTAILAGGTATLSAAGSGTEPLAFQWFASTATSAEVPVDGATGATVAVTPTVTTFYRVRIRNGCGEAFSETATVSINAPRRRHTVGR